MIDYFGRMVVVCGNILRHWCDSHERERKIDNSNVSFQWQFQSPFGVCKFLYILLLRILIFTWDYMGYSHGIGSF